jgi:hypothetical protein
MRFSNFLLVCLFALLTACGGGGEAETDTGGGADSAGSTADVPPASGTDDSAPFNLAGTWTDTDTVGSNSCGLPNPAPGSSRVTTGIVIEQDGNRITLTAPPNILGTRTVARGTLAADGSMTLAGSDSGSTITLNFRAVSDNEISGTSQVVAGGCTFNFSNQLVRTG